MKKISFFLIAILILSSGESSAGLFKKVVKEVEKGAKQVAKNVNHQVNSDTSTLNRAVDHVEKKVDHQLNAPTSTANCFARAVEHQVKDKDSTLQRRIAELRGKKVETTTTSTASTSSTTAAPAVSAQVVEKTKLLVTVRSSDLKDLVTAFGEDDTEEYLDLDDMNEQVSAEESLKAMLLSTGTSKILVLDMESICDRITNTDAMIDILKQAFNSGTLKHQQVFLYFNPDLRHVAQMAAVAGAFNGKTFPAE